MAPGKANLICRPRGRAGRRDRGRRRPSPALDGSTAQRRAAPARRDKILSHPPEAELTVFVCGTGLDGELGLGSYLIDGIDPITAAEPRQNPNLSPYYIGAVTLACGTAHTVTLQRDNTLVSWGKSTYSRLGRSTYEGPDSGLNNDQAIPGLVRTAEYIFVHPVWTQVVCASHATFVLSQDGKVYGWGTFKYRGKDARFDLEDEILPGIKQVEGVKDIVSLAAGRDHVLALDKDGRVFAWGNGEYGQLARGFLRSRRAEQSLRPVCIGNLGPGRSLKKAAKIACGSHHSFAIDENGKVYGWGLNNFGQLGTKVGLGECVTKPHLISSLDGYHIVDIKAGKYHSLALTADGEILSWGRLGTESALGLSDEDLNYVGQDDLVWSDGQVSALVEPTLIDADIPFEAIGAGESHSLAITTGGEVFSWGRSAKYQTGLDQLETAYEPVPIPREPFDDHDICFVDGGRNFSVFASAAPMLPVRRGSDQEEPSQEM